MKRRRELEVITSDLGRATVAIVLGGWSAEAAGETCRASMDSATAFWKLYDVGGIRGCCGASMRPRLREPRRRLWGWSPTFTLGGARRCSMASVRRTVGQD